MSDGQVLYRKSLYLLPNFVVNVKLLFSLPYLIVFIYFCHTVQLVGSHVPNQGLNPGHGRESPES